MAIQQFNAEGGLSVGNGLAAISIVAADGNISTTANVAGNYFLGNGSQLSGLPDGYSNTKVAGYLQTYSGNIEYGNLIGNTSFGNKKIKLSQGSLPEIGVLVDYQGITIGTGTPLAPQHGQFGIYATGNVTSTGNVAAANLLTDNLLYANGDPWAFGTNYSNANVAAYLPTYTGNLVSLQGDVTTTANISGNYYSGNGRFLTGLYSNADVANYLPTYTGNLNSLQGNITTTGNVQAAYFVGNGFSLEDVHVNSWNYANGFGNVYAGVGFGSTTVPVYIPGGNVAQSYPVNTVIAFSTDLANFYTVTETFPGEISMFYITPGIRRDIPASASAYYANGVRINGIASALNSNVRITVSSNVAFIDSLYANANVTDFLANGFGSNSITTTGNITAGYLTGNGAFITGLPSGYSNANVTDFLANGFGSNSITTTGNITAGYLSGNGSGITTGSVAASNLAYQVSVATTSTAATYSVAIVPGLSGGNYGMLIDGTSLLYNPGTDTLTVGVLTATLGVNINGSSGLTVAGSGGIQATYGITASSIVTQNTVTANSFVANVDVTTGNLTVSGNGTVSGFSIGYRDIPQTALSANVNLAADSGGRHYYAAPSAGNLTLTIQPNSSIGMNIGTSVLIVVGSGANVALARGSGVTLYLAGNSVSADRTVTTNGLGSLLKIDTDTWIVTGAGVV